MNANDNEKERLVDQIALVDALATFARIKVERDLVEAAVVRLARRLVPEPGASDSDVVRVAGRSALKALLERRP